MDVMKKLADAGVEVKDGKIKKSDLTKVMAGANDVQLKMEVTIWAEASQAEAEVIRRNLLDMIEEAEVSGKIHEGTAGVVYDVSTHVKIEPN